MRKKTKYILIFVVGIIIAAAQLTAIFFLSFWQPFLGALLLGFSSFGWMCLAHDHAKSDTSGKITAADFSSPINIFKSIIITVGYYLLLRYKFNEAWSTCIVFISVYFLVKVIIVLCDIIKENRRNW